MIEVWKSVARAPLYEVSNLGRVRRLAGYRCKSDRILRLRKVSDGYLAAHLCVNGVRFNGLAHQLVCEAFHGAKPSPLHQVAHNDGTRDNNAASNLRWATVAENAADRTIHGNWRNPNERLTADDAAIIRSSHEKASLLADRFGVSRNHIWGIRARRVRIADLRREGEAQA